MVDKMNKHIVTKETRRLVKDHHRQILWGIGLGRFPGNEILKILLSLYSLSGKEIYYDLDSKGWIKPELLVL